LYSKRWAVEIDHHIIRYAFSTGAADRLLFSD